MLDKTAFTLIELLVTITILALIAVFAIPSFSTYTLRTRVTTMYDAAAAAKFAVTNDYLNQGTLTSITYAPSSTAFTSPPASSCVTAIDIASGKITVTGDATKLSSKAINLIITPTATTPQQLTWACCVSSDAFLDFAPVECRTTCP